MHEQITTDHAQIVEVLPDYAVGVLDDVTTERLVRHLAGCAACRDQLSFLLETVARLAPARPQDAAKLELLARLGAAAGAGDRRPALIDAVPIPVPVPSAANPTPLARVRRPSRPWLRRAAPVWLAAALLVAPLAGWGIELQRRQDGQDEQELINRLVSDPTAMYQLSDIYPTGAAGTFYVDPAENQGYLVARGLPPLSADQRYRVWLQTDRGELIRAEALPVNANGEGQALVLAPAPFDAYFAAQIIPEQNAADPSQNPSSLPVLGGEIEET